MMQEMENVYEIDPQTEQGSVKDDKENGNDKQVVGSADLGKFKDVSALMQAYQSLQAEFTRRSQRLKELERQAENFKREKQKQTDGAAVAVEKLRKNAQTVKAERDKFDAFVCEIQEANVRADVDGDNQGKPAESQVLPKEEAFQEGIAEGADNVVQPVLGRESVADKEENYVLSSEELYEKASRDEIVRLKIIGDYLASIEKRGAPLMRGGGGALATSPQKPKTVREAGSMALHFFQKHGAQA